MITGITGAGKSSACNFLLGEKKFKVGLGLKAVTSKSGSHSSVVNGRKLNIIDTPGFCEDSKDDAENMQELSKAIILAKDGVHAVALVVNASHRFTSSQVQLLKELELLEDLWPYMFIIFSGAKGYGETDEEQRKSINEIYEDPDCPKDLKKLLDKIDKQFMMIESTETNQDYRDNKRKEFFKMVDRIYNRNKRLYSNKLFKRALEVYQEQKDKAKNKDKAHQEAIMKAETLAKLMREEIERMREQARLREESFQKAMTECKNTPQVVVVKERGCTIL